MRREEWRGLGDSTSAFSWIRARRRTDGISAQDRRRHAAIPANSTFQPFAKPRTGTILLSAHFARSFGCQASELRIWADTRFSVHL